MSPQWTVDCSGRVAGAWNPHECEPLGKFVAVEREMKAVLVFVLVVLGVLAAATVVAYGQAQVTAGVTAIASGAWREPTALLLSGSALLGIAGAVRRLPF
jgi:hypothetical protein